MKQLGMETSSDAAGNIHGFYKGKNPSKKSIIIGSHLDTVPHGGLFDGAYGVAGALEVLRRLKDNQIELEHPLEIYGFNAEESNPIGGTFGSRAITGLVDVKQPGFKEAIEKYGHTPEEILACQRELKMLSAILSCILNKVTVCIMSILMLVLLVELLELCVLKSLPLVQAIMRELR